MIDDAIFERDLRAMLTARDLGPPRSELSDQIRVRLVTDRRRGLGRRIETLVAAVGLIAAAVVVAFILSRPIATGPGASPAPTLTPPYALAAGDGVVDAEPPVAQAAIALMAIVALAAVALTRTRRQARIAVWLATLTAILVALSVGRSDGLGFRNGMYGVSPGRETGPQDDSMGVAVTGDQPFTLVLTVTNVSRLPLTVLGLQRPEVPEGASGPILTARFVGLGIQPPGTPDGAQTTRFHPVTIGPGEELDLAVLGMAGACAVPSPGPDGSGGYALDTVPLVYEQLTIQHAEDFPIPLSVGIATSDPCG